ncbi:MAG: hypothetical protein GXO86_03515 [Chlorobi bacterium]|nr:hypothetical protein [Chlorobiota bacterium]
MTKEKYPKPDRSDYTPNFVKDDYEQVDIGWNEGVLFDGRPYRVEGWFMDHITMVTYFFSTKGMENYTDDMFAELLTKEGLIEILSEENPIEADIITDAAGNEMWSVNVAIGTDDKQYARDFTPLNSYKRTGE